jgi:hypothetical protein
MTQVLSAVFNDKPLAADAEGRDDCSVVPGFVLSLPALADLFAEKTCGFDLRLTTFNIYAGWQPKKDGLWRMEDTTLKARNPETGGIETAYVETMCPVLVLDDIAVPMMDGSARPETSPEVAAFLSACKVPKAEVGLQANERYAVILTAALRVHWSKNGVVTHGLHSSYIDFKGDEGTVLGPTLVVVNDFSQAHSSYRVSNPLAVIRSTHLDAYERNAKYRVIDAKLAELNKQVALLSAQQASIGAATTSAPPTATATAAVQTRTLKKRRHTRKHKYIVVRECDSSESDTDSEAEAKRQNDDELYAQIMALPSVVALFEKFAKVKTLEDMSGMTPQLLDALADAGLVLIERDLQWVPGGNKLMAGIRVLVNACVSGLKDDFAQYQGQSNPSPVHVQWEPIFPVTSDATAAASAAPAPPSEDFEAV